MDMTPALQTMQKRFSIKTIAVNRYVQLLIVLMSAFMDLMDTTVVNVAIPTMESSLNADTNGIEWVITAYLLTLGVLIPITGWLTDRFGSKILFVSSTFIFTVGSSLCGLAWNLPSMVIFRIIQGIGGGFLMPVVMSILYQLFSEKERDIPMGIFGVVIATAPAIGPFIGGYFIYAMNWRLIFYINVPIGIIATILSMLMLQNFPHYAKDKLDIWGFIFSTVGFFSLLDGFSNVTDHGWHSRPVEIPLAIGIITLIIFVIIELKVKNPMIKLEIMKDFAFSLSLVIVGVIYVALFIGIFILPLYLQDIRGYSAMQVGIFMTPAYLASAVAMMIGGSLSKKYGARTFAILGLVLLVYADYSLSTLQVFSNFGYIQFLYVVRNVGMSFAIMPIMKAGLDRIPERMSNQAIALSNMARQVVSALGMAVLTSYMLTQTTAHFEVLRNDLIWNSPKGMEVSQSYLAFKLMGFSDAKAHELAFQFLGYVVQKLSFTRGVADTFFVSEIIELIMIVFVIFFKADAPYPKLNGGSNKTLFH